MMRGCLLLSVVFLAGCSRSETPPNAASGEQKKSAKPTYFKVDPATAGVLTGTVRFTGRKPKPALIDMDQDPQCAATHPNGRAVDESVIVNKNGTLSNVFIYLKSGLEGKAFEPPSTPATIDQKTCWFRPRVLGIQTGQPLRVTNSDPVTHNIHPLAQSNREWNQSQAPEDPPLSRRFVRPEVMIRVKCNVHNWMRAWIGVLDHPYFAVTDADGSFEIKGVPPGAYTIAAWQEQFGAREQTVTVSPSGKVQLDFSFTGE